MSIPDAALVVDDAGTVAWVGAHRDLPGEYASWPVTGDASAILLPGFVDTHVHFPQTFSSDGFGGGQLLEWLDRTVFPAETRLADPDFADVVARAFTRRRVRAGTTAAMVFGSAFPAAQDALFERTREAGLRIVSGRGSRPSGPPPPGDCSPRRKTRSRWSVTRSRAGTRSTPARRRRLCSRSRSFRASRSR